ncbi:hypothetical protein H257_09673 [Aphanomyces astaci]|uniref:Uncharacterized protein n=1 Tax=Aphanomyces astaci TaxID=112090 RepID=W4G907_APHAT|nr:hypothetical protein H257_09673 [Aphanomyces astaci]ETV76145.1 hypothetical protein H257_09673 [Aphanomyces astaci]|eukprot:XP_009834270.1 hypothetical protein H257_09673 [Aphanomyces astaci]
MGSYRCLQFQYMGTGECPSNVNGVVAPFTTPKRTERCDTKISTSLYGVPGHCQVQSDVTGDVISTMHMGCCRFTLRQFSCAGAPSMLRIALVVHPRVLASTYASIRWLRQDLNYSLPIEDYWKPDNTCFGIDGYSMLWDLMGIDFVDMFEQESGQLDLYRLAWLKAAVPFHMIERSPGCLGCRLRPIRGGGGFCGKTMAKQNVRRDVHLANYKPVSYVLGDLGCFGHSYALVDMYTETKISQTVASHDGGHVAGCPQDQHHDPFEDAVGSRLNSLPQHQSTKRSTLFPPTL